MEHLTIRTKATPASAKSGKLDLYMKTLKKNGELYLLYLAALAGIDPQLLEAEVYKLKKALRDYGVVAN